MSAEALSGVAVSPGRASGRVVRVVESLGEPASGPAPVDPTAEAARIAPASRLVVTRLEALADAATGEAATILSTTAAMAGDPALLSQAEQLVRTERISAARAVFQAARASRKPSAEPAGTWPNECLTYITCVTGSSRNCSGWTRPECRR